jgi:hypothetical protein
MLGRSLNGGRHIEHVRFVGGRGSAFPGMAMRGIGLTHDANIAMCGRANTSVDLSSGHCLQSRISHDNL